MKAFEYACARALADFINTHPEGELTAVLTTNSFVETARRDFDRFSAEHQERLIGAGKALGRVLEKTEPRLLYKTPGLADTVELFLQSDSRGIKGDVRGVLAVRAAMTNGDGWEIGMCCSWPKVDPAMDMAQLPAQISKDDFYGVVISPGQRHIDVQGLNFHGTLGKAAGERRPLVRPAQLKPFRGVNGVFAGAGAERIISIDAGWQFTVGEDVRVAGMPPHVFRQTMGF